MKQVLLPWWVYLITIFIIGLIVYWLSNRRIRKHSMWMYGVQFVPVEHSHSVIEFILSGIACCLCYDLLNSLNII